MKRRVTAVALLVAASMFAAASSGAATVTPFSFTYPVDPTEITADETCAGVEGILTGTETAVGHDVETGSGIFHYTANVTGEFRIDYVNGWYELLSWSYIIAGTGKLPFAEGFLISTGPLQGRATLYDANGTDPADRFNRSRCENHRLS